MVELRRGPGDGVLIVLRPNRSATGRGLLGFFLGLALVTAAVAAFWTALGAWPVAPFAGLELAGVGLGLYVAARRCARVEVIAVGPERIRVERGHRRSEWAGELPRAWARVVRCHGRVALRAQGQELEVGAFLAEDERERLAAELRRALAS